MVTKGSDGRQDFAINPFEGAPESQRGFAIARASAWDRYDDAALSVSRDPGPLSVVSLGRSCAGALAAVLLLAGCGSGVFITGDARDGLHAPLPTTGPDLRADLRRIRATLEQAKPAAEARQTGHHAAACQRLSNLIREMEDGFARYDLSQEAFHEVDQAYKKCDEQPALAVARLGEALSLPVRTP